MRTSVEGSRLERPLLSEVMRSAARKEERKKAKQKLLKSVRGEHGWA